MSCLYSGDELERVPNGVLSGIWSSLNARTPLELCNMLATKWLNFRSINLYGIIWLCVFSNQGRCAGVVDVSQVTTTQSSGTVSGEPLISSKIPRRLSVISSEPFCQPPRDTRNRVYRLVSPAIKAANSLLFSSSKRQLVDALWKFKEKEFEAALGDDRSNMKEQEKLKAQLKIPEIKERFYERQMKQKKDSLIVELDKMKNSQEAATAKGQAIKVAHERRINGEDQEERKELLAVLWELSKEQLTRDARLSKLVTTLASHKADADEQKEAFDQLDQSIKDNMKSFHGRYLGPYNGGILTIQIPSNEALSQRIYMQWQEYYSSKSLTDLQQYVQDKENLKSMPK